MFGGIINRTMTTNELWSFHPSSLAWTPLSPFDNLGSSGSVVLHPFAVAGHTAHAVGDQMYVIFGHNPHRGYLPYVQKYDFRK